MNRFFCGKKDSDGKDTYLLKELDFFEVETSYVWNLLVYVGKGTDYEYKIARILDEEKQNFTKPTSIVLRLIAPMLNQGYTLGVDNFYTSPKLIDVLIANQTDCIGTERLNQKGFVPK